MIKQPRKEYLEKLVAYNKKYYVVSTMYLNTSYFTNKRELIKRIIISNDNSLLNIMTSQLFVRYLNYKTGYGNDSTTP